MSSRSDTICAIAEGRKRQHQLDKAGQTILQLLTKPLMLPSKTADMRSIRRKSFHTSFGPPRIALRSLRLRLKHTERADRAEQWLHKVYTEIEDRFLDRDKNVRRRA